MVIAPWRRTLLCCLMVSPMVLLGSGCKTASGWRTPWSAWGGASSPDATALNISKPSTQAPAPSNPPGQPNRSIAANGGAAGSRGNPSGVAMAGATSPTNPVTAYPATPQADAYPTQPAGNLQQGAGAGEQVAPAGGLQVGPYSMQSNPAASNYAAAPKGSAPAAAEGPYGGREDYRTADRGAARNYGGGAPADDVSYPQANEAGSVYGGAEGAATATESSVYGPDEETSPAGGDNSYSPTNYPTSEASDAPASDRSYGPPNTVAPRPSTSPPSSSSSTRTSLPASLSAAGGYRPGSTGGYGANNAGYDQPQNASAAEGAQTGGTVYR